MRRCIELLFLVAGLAGVGVWVWSEVRLHLYQQEAKRTLEHSAALRPPAAPQAPAAPGSHLADGALVGKLVIPRLKLEAVVREGAGEGTLEVALGHIPGTALPGGSGNVGIAGHRDTLFRGLRHVKKDDLIQLETPAGKYQYEVEDTRIVTPSDVEVLKAGAHPELTLVTCYPFYYVGSAPNRFIVKARSVDAEPPTITAESHPPVAKASPAPVKPRAAVVKVRAVTPRKPALPPPVQNVTRFQVEDRGTCQLAPGILMGLSGIDANRRHASGWIWMASERRTIWLRDLAVNQPLIFRQLSNGKQREVLITSVSDNSVAGYLLQGR